MKRFHLRILLLTLTLLLPILACNALSPDDDPAVEPVADTPVAVDPDVDATDEPEASEEPTAETEMPSQEESATVNRLEDVEGATVYILAEGSFVDPQVGQVFNAAGTGSGFIIDPSGIAVTNNHVVTGAALLKVWVGESDEPLNARVLGVSECSDLAVIDIDGEGFPSLQWYDGDIDVGLDVYAAGFPLSDPEFTLTRGIVSKAAANGDSSWASVDNVLEHDARINPGNSGGPLVSADGHVVGVNYAGNQNTSQYFAISQDEALGVIEALRAGTDVTSIGINGQAIASEEDNLYGIWVSSVKSGSPADQAGIEPGDIVTQLENLVLSTDGTMSDYCDILRSRGPGDVLSVEVLRFSTQEVLEGQINGDPLEVTFDFSQQLGEEVGADTAAGQEAGYASYTAISDNSGRLSVEVPSSWSDIDGSPWLADDGSELGPAVAASTNLDEYYNTWTTPGMQFAAFFDVTATEEDLLDVYEFESCTYDGRYDYSDPLYTGMYDLWVQCGGTDTAFIVLATTPEDNAYLTLVAIQVVTDQDLEAMNQIMDTFVVNP